MFGLASSSPFATLMPVANTGASMPSDRMVTRVGARESCAGTCLAAPPLLRPVLIAGAASEVSATSAHFVSVSATCCAGRTRSLYV